MSPRRYSAPSQVRRRAAANTHRRRRLRRSIDTPAVLEAGAVAVIERPIRPFGLAHQPDIARSIWLEKRETESVSETGAQTFGPATIQKAKSSLDDGQGFERAEAYESIRRRPMAKRLSMDDMPQRSSTQMNSCSTVQKMFSFFELRWNIKFWS